MDPIIDSKLTREEALKQNLACLCPEEILQQQELVTVKYWSFDEKVHEGQIVVARGLQEDIEEIFESLLSQKFPIQSVIPIADEKYHWDDEISMQVNNSSGFNYRFVARTSRLSNHALGYAVDINPLLNPQIIDDFIQPKGASYDISKQGTIAADSFVVKIFKEHGWTWGGDWKDRVDYQHFNKLLPTV